MRNKILFLFFSFVAFSGFGWGGWHIAQPVHLVVDEESTPVEDYSDIIWYLTCDSKSDAEISGGTATVNWDTNLLINSTVQKVGIACCNSDDKAYSDFDFLVSGNIDFASGRFGFWYYGVDSWDYGGSIATTVGGDFQIEVDDTNEALKVTYMGTTEDDLVSTLSRETWYFFEFEFNGNVCDFYVDGTHIVTVTGSGTPNDTSMSIMAQSGVCHDFMCDNVMASNDADRDLYAIAYDTPGQYYVGLQTKPKSSDDPFINYSGTYAGSDNYITKAGSIIAIEFYLSAEGLGSSISIATHTKSGNDFTAIDYAFLPVSGAGFYSFTSPSDFDAFDVDVGDWVSFYGYGTGLIDAEENVSGQGYYLYSGDGQVGTKTFTSYTSSDVQIQIRYTVLET